MISSKFVQRIFLPIGARTLSTKPTSHFHDEDPKQHKYDLETVCEALSCYSNDWKRALDFFYWVQTDCNFQHPTHTYNYIIDILGKFFEFDLSWDLISKMQKDSFAVPNHTTFRILFKRYISAHLVNEAISTYNRLEEFNLKDETSYCNLIDALCEYKHVIEACELYFGKSVDDAMKVKITSPGTVTKIHNMILRGWFKMSWWSKCREFWEEMDKKGVDKDLYSFSIYMDVQCKSGKPWKAVKLYKEMKRRGIKLDVVAYNTVIQAIGKSEGVDFATRVYREMKELGCSPNVVTCNIVIKLLCENGRVEEAYKILDKMPKEDIMPNVITYHCFFRCMEKPNEILWMFDRMIATGILPIMDTYVMLLRKFGRWGFLRPVFIVWNKMLKLGCCPDEFAYNALIDVLIEKGMVDVARTYYEEMVAKGLPAKPRAELNPLREEEA